jgi:hypothetical protein
MGKALTHEEVVGVWVWTTNLEQLHQIMELAVNVTTHGHWAFLLHMCERFGSRGLELESTYDWLDVGLVLENFPRL